MIASRGGFGDVPFGSGNVSTALDGNGNLTLAVANVTNGTPAGTITINPNAVADAAAALNANGLDVVGVLPAGGSGMPAVSTSDGSAAQNILNCGTSNCGALSQAPSNYNYLPGPTSAPFCGSGSAQWVSGIDNCVLIGASVAGVFVLVLIAGKKRGRK